MRHTASARQHGRLAERYLLALVGAVWHGVVDEPGARNGNFRHGRNTKEVVVTRQWLREAIHTLRELNKHP